MLQFIEWKMGILALSALLNTLKIPVNGYYEINVDGTRLRQITDGEFDNIEPVYLPDGTGQMVYYGNLHPGTVMIDAKPTPGTDKVVCGFSPGHGQKEHAGRVTIVSPKKGTFSF
jgi:hypothetical protein